MIHLQDLQDHHYPAYDKLDVEKLILQLNEMKHITLDQSALLPAENHLHQKQLLT